ncbi:MAG: flagellar basal body-associated FliL family protein [Tissierellaceae bacterium]
MSKRTIIIIIIVLFVVLIAGIVAGLFLFSNNSGKKVKEIKTFDLTMDEMYCNIKESKRIVKIKITVETIKEKTLVKISEKQFLIRDEVNKIIRNLSEEELQGKDGQNNLQKAIKKSLVDIFNDENIVNVYFDDFIIQ